jgi:hypothetical protein
MVLFKQKGFIFGIDISMAQHGMALMTAFWGHRGRNTRWWKHQIVDSDGWYVMELKSHGAKVCFPAVLCEVKLYTDRYLMLDYLPL